MKKKGRGENDISFRTKVIVSRRRQGKVSFKSDTGVS
jgi:hypothetical protein